MSNQRHYEIVAQELQRRFLRPGLWVRAVAEVGGEGDAARAFYIRLRVAELIQIEEADRAAQKARAKEEKQEAQDRERAERLGRKKQREAEGASYEGPRCVSCRAPIQVAVKICPQCGWTQP